VPERTGVNNVTVNNAKAVYDQQSQSSKAKKWLTLLSERITHYGAIMDTLSQHHPEYVSLAWGAMKFFFIVSSKTLFKLRGASRLPETVSGRS